MFEKRSRPVFIKKGSSAEGDLRLLTDMLEGQDGYDRDRLKKDLKLLEAGAYGERQIVFELENSHLPMYVLQDLFFEHDGLSSQIDFLVVAPYVNLVVECKNLFGDITVTDDGEWMRKFDYGCGPKQEGIYSPITQNERHLRLMKAIRQADQGFLGKLASEHWFRDWYRSVVVLANHKTILKASKSHRKLVTRADGLVGYIKRLNEECKANGKRGIKEMEQTAQYWLSKHVEKRIDLTVKYALSKESLSVGGANTSVGTIEKICPRCGSPMVLRTARRGNNAGSSFYGCTRYPECRGTVNLR